ncbi:O-antigen polymerase [Halovenus sp. HT40]|uniref:O-antigen polymerase n=1 Tax=Halovenus sp. HT40 TaxID=3126691 RepID=UPI00300F4FA7
MRDIELRIRYERFGEVIVSYCIPNVLRFFLSIATVMLGTVIFLTKALALAPFFFILGYVCILLTITYQTAISRDPFNPLTLILSLGLLRFGLPYLLFYFGAPRSGAQNLIRLLSLTESHLILSHILWIIGLNALIFGWFAFPRRVSDPVDPFDFSIGPYATVFAGLLFLFGTANIATFVHLNADILQAVKTGSFRGQQITPGTGIYWYLGLSTISAASVMAATIIARSRAWYHVALVPGLVAMGVLWILGGRARALTPVVIVALLVWYRWFSRPDRTVQPFRILAVGAALVPVLMWFLHLSNLYQRGFGIRSLSLSFTSFPRYVSNAVYTDIGDFQGIAGAVAVGGGVLKGNTFGVLFWPLSEGFPIGRSTGAFIVETRMGRDGFGVGPTLIGDAYVNFGLLGVIIVLSVFGLVLKWLYAQFVQHRIRPVIYAIVAVYAIRLMFESINKWSELVVVSGFTGIVVIVSVFVTTRSNPTVN